MRMNIFHEKIGWITITALIVVVSIFFVYRKYELDIAHSTFENYYSFRRCAQLLQRTDAEAQCRLSDGTNITIVKINSKWYLEGDGPGIW
jgi:hypothetical protein